MPADEVVVRRLMSFLERLGDGVAAIRAYEAFAWRLAQELELHPSAETQQLAERIRRNQREHAPAPTLQAAGVEIDAKHSRRRLRPARMLSAAALSVVGLVAASVLLGGPPQRAAARARFPLNFEGQPALAGGIGGNTIALSPDGNHLVYLGRGAAGDQLFLRRMSVLEAVPIPETRDARHPFFSPDGEWLGYIAGNAIRKVRVAGGPAISVAHITTNVPGISWGDDDTMVFATPSGLWQVPASGGEPAPLALSDTARGERYRWPHVLPGGNGVLFTRIDRSGFHLAALSRADRKVVHLGIRGTSPRFIAPGRLVYSREGGTLLTARFDPRTLRVQSGPAPMTEDVYVGVAGEAKLGASRTGVLAYVPKPEGGRLLLVDGDGRTDTVSSGSLRFYSPRFSPDGSLVATSIWSPDGSQDLWLIDAASTTMRRITFDSGSVAPVWSPDGSRVAYSSKPAGRRFGWAIRSTSTEGGTSSPELLVAPTWVQFPASFTRGDTLVFERTSVARKTDIWLMPPTGAREPLPYMKSAYNERGPALSPSGRWLAYVSDESGSDEVYVASFPRPGVPLQVSSGGGQWPRWASDRELAYRTGDGIAAVELRESSGVLSVGARRSLFRADRDVIPVEGLSYDVQGQRLAVFLNARKPVDIMVLMNWFDDPALAEPPPTTR
jgi:serine/threonine-protein kinase